jgi:hypothetical protein
LRIVTEFEVSGAPMGALERLRGLLAAMEEHQDMGGHGPGRRDLEALGFDKPRLTRAAVEGEEVNEEAWMEGADLVVVEDRRELALRVGDLGLARQNLEVLAERLLALGRIVYAAGRRAGQRARDGA